MVSKKLFSLGVTILFLGTVGFLTVIIIKNAVFAATTPILTFTESGITETVAGNGYTITDKTLAIKASGTYHITGTCTTDCNIYVKKGTTGVTLILEDLTLSATSTSPLAINKATDEGVGTEVTVKLLGTSTLTDNETDTTLPDYEGAAIKVKTGSSLTFTGPGTLNVVSDYKNGIKGASKSSITFNGGTFNVTAINNGIAADGTLTFNRGVFNVETRNDGIKAAPELGDLESAGALYINGGTFNINAYYDGIQAAKTLLITNGTFTINTFQKYNTACPEEHSCKGIKGTSENENDDPLVTITGGTFTINSSDDSVHSDGDMIITGGTFTIDTNDDGIHSEKDLTIGTENGFERDPEITINHGYEGIEGEKVFIYSGRIKIKTRDDGINAAGGGDPEGECYDPKFQVYIYGGELHINGNNDGIDSNGDIHIYGGTVLAFSQTLNGMSLNEALDRCGSIFIDGATVFTAGDKGLDPITSIGSSQKFIISTSRYSANSKLAINNGNEVLFNDVIPKATTYTFFTSPELGTNASITSLDQLDACKASTWQQTWDSGVITMPATPYQNGVMTFTSNCQKIERKTILYEPIGGEYNVFNNTNDKALVTFGGVTSTDDFNVITDNGTLTIESNEACMVIVTNDRGATFERILASPTSSENIYTFEIDTYYEGDIYIVLAGDVTMNGTVNSLDSVKIDYSLLSTSNINFQNLTSLEALIADVTYNNRVNSLDSAAIDYSLLSESNINYKKIDWTRP